MMDCCLVLFVRHLVTAVWYFIRWSKSVHVMPLVPSAWRISMARALSTSVRVGSGCGGSSDVSSASSGSGVGGDTCDKLSAAEMHLDARHDKSQCHVSGLHESEDYVCVFLIQ